ncbi:Hcp family type VI secretion system effector [Pseudogemmobacter humi]|uniref:Major exported protein n=1 Tax=Pseudogemmobacter humi TaxID=2483812 RepID=A0A3P5XD27_9RHOB|nr:type VI secretion system tube protein Hcp [Pseudogemmobacter humi]VDC32767.1 hypothetical protein XINFAN_03446 [Pseudogemmobacter humi]
MAMDIFIKLGDIKGESKDKAHAGKTDVLAWSWGASNSGSAHMGGGQGAGKANVQDLSITKWVDLGSPDILKFVCLGTHIPEIVLIVRKAGGNPLEYITITMSDCILTSVSTGGSGGEDRLTENVTINFAKVKMQYVEQKKDGSAGDKPDFTFDIAGNAAG